MLKNKKHKSGVHRPEGRSVPRREDASPAAGFFAALRASFFGTLAACLIFVTLILLGTAVAYAQDDPDRWTAPIGYAAAAVTALASGAVASHRNGRAVLLCGLLAASFLLLIFSVLSLFSVFSDLGNNSVGLSLGLHASLILFAVGGAYIGRRRGRR